MTEGREAYDPDWDAVGAAMRDAIKKSRGYATWWEWAPARPLHEHHVASVLSRFLFGDDAVDALTFPNQDPPDVVLPIAGLCIGIEVTEIIDPKAVETARYLKRKRDGWNPRDLALANWPWPDWTDNRLQDAIGAAIGVKDKKLAAVAGGYAEIYLAMATDEPDVDVEQAARVVGAMAAETTNIDRAFLLLGYNPAVDKGFYPDRCPVFEIKLQ